MCTWHSSGKDINVKEEVVGGHLDIENGKKRRFVEENLSDSEIQRLNVSRIFYYKNGT